MIKKYDEYDDKIERFERLGVEIENAAKVFRVFKMRRARYFATRERCRNIKELDPNACDITPKEHKKLVKEMELKERYAKEDVESHMNFLPIIHQVNNEIEKYLNECLWEKENA